MNIATRVAATATAVVSISALGVPLATSASASHYRGAGIRVCVQGLRGGDADVYVAGRSAELEGGECATFRGLRWGRTYRVSADAGRGCRIFNDEKYVTARRDARTVVFFGRCWGRDGGGWQDNDGGGWRDNDGRDGGGWRDGMGRGPR